VSRLARPANRIATGSRTYARRLASRAAAWCARGRRTDLTGWRAALGVFVRLGLLVLGAYVLARLVRALPSLMWVLTGWWTLASWRAGKPADEDPKETPADAPAEPDREAVCRLLLDLMGTGHGVHLRTVLAHLQQHGQWQGRTVSDLRVHLERLDIPVDPKLKVGGTPTRGVRRQDVQAPSPAAPQETSPRTSTAA
jgi:hypothetical protein